MSERGLLLALQRLHDDPGFINLVAADPQNTLGIYDLDETECNALIQATTNKDEATLREMASKVGIDWKSDHVSGAGALATEDVSLEGPPVQRGVDTSGKKIAAFGVDWVTGPARSGNSGNDLAEDIHTGSPIKPAGS